MFLSRKNKYCENDYTTKAICRFNAIPIKLPMTFDRTRTKKFHNSYGNTKDPEQPKQSCKRRMELEESTFLTSDYTIKLQSSKQYGTGTKTETQTNGTRQKAQKQSNALMDILYLTKEARIYNGAKTASSINDAGKTGQLHVKE